MRRAVVAIYLVLAAGALTFACGDDDEESSGGPGMCKAPGVPGAESCTSAERKAYGECVEDACNDKYIECYGPSYKWGEYSGPCADYLTCTNKCECEDLDCYLACDASAACNSCMQGFVGCALSCTSKLACANVNLGDAGPTFADGSIGFGDTSIALNKTCADLLSCCNSLTDASDKSECMMTHSTAAATGAASNLVCTAAYSVYCP